MTFNKINSRNFTQYSFMAALCISLWNTFSEPMITSTFGDCRKLSSIFIMGLRIYNVELQMCSKLNHPNESLKITYLKCLIASVHCLLCLMYVHSWTRTLVTVSGKESSVNAVAEHIISASVTSSVTIVNVFPNYSMLYRTTLLFN